MKDTVVKSEINERINLNDPDGYERAFLRNCEALIKGNREERECGLVQKAIVKAIAECLRLVKAKEINTMDLLQTLTGVIAAQLALMVGAMGCPEECFEETCMGAGSAIADAMLANLKANAGNTSTKEHNFLSTLLH